MLHSDTLGAIAPALAKAQAKLEHAAKGRDNEYFNSKYADLPKVIDTIKPVLAEHGLAIIQGFVPDETGVTIETRIIHSSGEWISDEGLHLPAKKADAQAFGSAATYARRYALMALIGLAADDDDGNAAVAAAPKTAAKAAPKKAEPRLVSPEQAAELAAAAIAAGTDPALAERQAKNTHASRFIEALTKLKEKSNA